MKRLICIIIIFCFAVCGCSSQKTSSYQSNFRSDGNGGYVDDREGQKVVMPSNLPAPINYNGKTITLASAKAYELLDNYEYTLFLIAELDLSSLSDVDRHWLIEEDLEGSAYITCENNKQDFSTAPTLGKLIDGSKFYFVFTSSFFDRYRHTFGGSKISVSITVTQENQRTVTTSKGSSYQRNDTEEILYTFTLDEKLPDEETISQPLYKYIAKWLREKAEKYK